MVRVKKQQQLLLLCQPSGIHVHALDLLESKHCSKAHGTANFSWIFVHETEKGKFGRRFASPPLYLFLKERIRSVAHMTADEAQPTSRWIHTGRHTKAQNDPPTHITNHNHTYVALERK